MSKPKINPDYVNAPLQMAIMTRDGCYTCDNGQWYQFRGVDEETGENIFVPVDETQVPESFKRCSP